MTDREKLIDLLCKAKSKAIDEILSDDISYAQQLEIEADHLLANGVRLEAKQVTSDENKRWIPVTERLPEPETDVLTFSGGCIDIITYRYNRRGLACFMFRDDCGYWKETFVKITHWMPLPSTEGLK